MNGKHTPGPWRIAKQDNRSGAIVSDVPSGWDDADNLRGYGGYLIAESVKPHNAALIAAAPTLFAACKAALESLEMQSCVDDDDDDPLAELATRLRSAIEIAEEP